MNVLILGSDKSTILEHLPERFLIIDDGLIIDQLELPERRTITVFDPEKHSFNPLNGIDYRKAREFVQLLDAIFPEGANTLTKRHSTFILLKALLSNPDCIQTLIPPGKDTADAYEKIQTLLFSPVLKRVLNGNTNLTFKGTMIARLDRAALGDFDCFVLANLLISQYRGPVVVPDFGFYACAFHVGLIRQDRLVAGINSFDEVPSFRDHLVLFENKYASGCSAEDAKVLARYAGLAPDTNAYNDFIQMSLRSA